MKLNPMITTEHISDEKYIFVPLGSTKNQGYSESAWSSFMCQLFKDKTGVSVSVNMLRSSFITFFYGSENVNLRESIASGMRHSVHEVQKTYDRRYFSNQKIIILFFTHVNILTGFEKKRKAVDFCGTNTMHYLGENDESVSNVPKNMKQGPTKEQKFDDNEPHSNPPKQGDIVAVPFKNEDTQQLEFWLGKCLQVNTDDSTLLLGWFEKTGEN
jgi:hypothetical protein